MRSALAIKQNKTLKLPKIIIFRRQIWYLNTLLPVALDTIYASAMPTTITLAFVSKYEQTLLR
jgi:hypothetical protein